MNLYRITLIGMTVAFATLSTPSARAAEAYDNCTGFIPSLPAVILTQGTWCMNKDLATPIATGNAITIAANNVTIDCNGFKIGGLAAGTATEATGISSTARSNTSVRGCNVRGFYSGIQLDGPGSLVERNRLDGNTVYGILVIGDYGMIRENLVFDTGGSTAGAGGSAYGIRSLGGVDIVGNSVAAVASTSEAAAWGIHTMGAPAVIAGNTVRDVVASGSGIAYSIYAAEDHSSIQGNVVYGTTVPSSVGINCSASLHVFVRDNTVARVGTPLAATCQAVLDNQTF